MTNSYITPLRNRIMTNSYITPLRNRISKLVDMINNSDRVFGEKKSSLCVLCMTRAIHIPCMTAPGQITFVSSRPLFVCVLCMAHANTYMIALSQNTLGSSRPLFGIFLAYQYPLLLLEPCPQGSC